MAIAVLLRGSFEELTKTYWNALQRDLRLHLQVRESAFGYLGVRRLQVARSLREEEKIRIFYENPSAALRSFQQIGAAVLNGQPNHNLLKPGEVRRLLADYERHARLRTGWCR